MAAAELTCPLAGEKDGVYPTNGETIMDKTNIMLYLGAIALGAFHALEPGHGKTVIAAYMIGSKGRARDGAFLGFVVTITHTFSVILLGIVAKLLSRTYTETELHAWLGLISSIIIIVVGLWMLKERISPRRGHHHLNLFGGPHDHGHDVHHHSHGDHQHHDHPHSSSGVNVQPGYNTWNLLLLGISGGLVPCPAAIATLLAAIAAGRIGQGLFMAVLFSVGLGSVMVALGVFLSHAGRLTAKIGENLEFGRRMGIVSAMLIVILGCYTLYHSVRGVL